jgi:DNA-binding MarR family transcriptional regulator
MVKKEQAAAESDQSIIHNLSLLGQKIRFMQRRQAMDQGLAPLQLSVIHLLSDLESEGPVHPASLAKALDISRPTLSDAIKALEQKRLLLIVRGKADRRRSELQLTERGRETAHIGKMYLRPLEQIIAHIPTPQKRNLGSLVSGILWKLSDTLS